jgi:hypothetical protein
VTWPVLRISCIPSSIDYSPVLSRVVASHAAERPNTSAEVHSGSADVQRCGELRRKGGGNGGAVDGSCPLGHGARNVVASGEVLRHVRGLRDAGLEI